MLHFKPFQVAVIVACILGTLGGIGYGNDWFTSPAVADAVMAEASIIDATATPAPDSTTPTRPPQNSFLTRIFGIGSRTDPIPDPAPGSAPVVVDPTVSPTPLVVNLDEAVIEDLERQLTVNLDDFSKAYPKVPSILLTYSYSDYDAKRQAATGLEDAVSMPFTMKDSSAKKLDAQYSAASVLEEVKQEILRSPLYGDMVIRGLVDVKISGGKTFGQLNPWMDEFIKATDGYMSTVARDIKNGTHPRGMEHWLTIDPATGNTVVTEKYREYAVLTCTLLDRFASQGFYSWKSTKNYHLPPIAYNCSRRTELADYQESKPALVLSAVRKDNVADVVIGFNLLDKRLEFFREQSASYGGTGTPDSPNPYNPPSTPDTPSTPDKPGTSYYKDYSYDPYSQGNASTGGHNVTNTHQTKPEDASTFTATEPVVNQNPIAAAPSSTSTSSESTSPASSSSTSSTPTVTVNNGTTTTTTSVDSGGTTVQTVTNNATGATSTTFNPDPPAAAPAEVPSSTYVDTSGGSSETVTITAEDTFSGEIAIPD